MIRSSFYERKRFRITKIGVFAQFVQLDRDRNAGLFGRYHVVLNIGHVDRVVAIIVEIKPILGFMEGHFQERRSFLCFRPEGIKC